MSPSPPLHLPDTILANCPFPPLRSHCPTEVYGNRRAPHPLSQKESAGVDPGVPATLLIVGHLQMRNLFGSQHFQIRYTSSWGNKKGMQHTWTWRTPSFVFPTTTCKPPASIIILSILLISSRAPVVTLWANELVFASVTCTCILIVCPYFWEEKKVASKKNVWSICHASITHYRSKVWGQ